MPIQNVSSSTSFQNKQVNFCGEVISTPKSDVKIPEQLEADKVDLSNKKEDKKLSKTQKAIIGIGATAATLLTATALIAKNRTNKLKQLYDKKLVMSDLAPHIDFKEAKTLEEGIAFAQNVLKIPVVDKNFTLESINYANKGLVEVSNANKGHLFIPRQLVYEDMKENTLAYVVRCIDSDRFGTLAINKKFFDSATLDKKLSRFFPNNETANKAADATVKMGKEGNVDPQLKLYKKLKKIFQFVPAIDEKNYALFEKYRQDPTSLSIIEKRNLYYDIKSIINVVDTKLTGYPMGTVKEYLPEFNKYNIKVNIDDFEKLSLTQQKEQLNDLLLELQSKVGKIKVSIPTLSPTETIHHELGHLQDFAKNLKDLDLSTIKSFSNAWRLSRKYGKDSDKIDILSNRWKGLTYDNLADVFKNQPEVFKQKYPDLYEFLTDKASQEAAGKVSHYATTSIGEFIAETYGKMVRGEKIPDDVMALYKKYNGPLIPFS